MAAGIPPGFDVLDETAERSDFDTRFERFADTLLADPDAEPALVRGFSLGLSRDDLAEIARALHRHWDRLEDGGLEVLERMRPGARRMAAGDARAGARRHRRGRGHEPVVHRRRRQAEGAPGVSGRGAGQLASCDDEPVDAAIPRRPAHAAAQLRPAGELGRPCRRGPLRLRGGGAGAPGSPAAPVVTPVLARARCPPGDVRHGGGRPATGRGPARLPRPARARPEAPATRHAAPPVPCAAATGACSSTSSRTPIPSRSSWRPASPPPWTARPTWRDAEPGGLFVVGDPKQSIYRFRRADIELFSRVGRQIGEEIVLVTNFRSVPGILGFVNTVFEELFGTEPVPGQAAHHELRRRSGPHPAPLPGRLVGQGHPAGGPARDPRRAAVPRRSGHAPEEGAEARHGPPATGRGRDAARRPVWADR